MPYIGFPFLFICWAIKKQRNHHQNAEQSAEHRHQNDARDFEIESENQNGRHRDADAERAINGAAQGGVRLL